MDTTERKRRIESVLVLIRLISLVAVALLGTANAASSDMVCRVLFCQ